MFNQTDVSNLIALINKAPIVGQEAEVVADLKNKLNALLTKVTDADSEIPKKGKNNSPVSEAV